MLMLSVFSLHVAYICALDAPIPPLFFICKNTGMINMCSLSMIGREWILILTSVAVFSMQVIRFQRSGTHAYILPRAVGWPYYSGRAVVLGWARSCG